MPWYRVGDTLMHIRVNKRQRKKMPPPCRFFLWKWHTRDDGTRERLKVFCNHMTAYECDWPGCNAPFCEGHRLNIGDNVDVCPTHNHKRGLFSRLLPAP